MFDADHFKANKRYRWNNGVGWFSIPNIRQMISNLEQGNTLPVIKKIATNATKGKRKHSRKNKNN